MTWKNIKLIFLREVRDQLRDRRTLFMVAVLPLLLYPALGVGMMQMTLTFTEQTRTVVVLGADDLPPAAADRPGPAGTLCLAVLPCARRRRQARSPDGRERQGNLASKEQQVAAGMVARSEKPAADRGARRGDSGPTSS